MQLLRGTHTYTISSVGNEDFILSQDTNDLSNTKDSKGQYARIEYLYQCFSQFSYH